MQDQIILPWLALILCSPRLPVCVHRIQVSNFQQQINNVLLLFAILFQLVFTFILQNIVFISVCFIPPKLDEAAHIRMIEQLQVFYQVNKSLENYSSVMEAVLD